MGLVIPKIQVPPKGPSVTRQNSGSLKLCDDPEDPSIVAHAATLKAAPPSLAASKPLAPAHAAATRPAAAPPVAVKHAISAGAAHPAHAIAAGAHHPEHLLGQIAVRSGHVTIYMRPLTPAERHVAVDVFGRTVPLDRVLILPLSGRGNRPFTVPGTHFMAVKGLLDPFAPSVSSDYRAAELLADIHDKYLIFLGKQGYNDALHHPLDRGHPGRTLVHELAHVWQGAHGPVDWSLLARTCQAGKAPAPHAHAHAHAHGPHAGPPHWKDIPAEAQALLVEQWFADGKRQTKPHPAPPHGHPRPAPATARPDPWPYIRDNVRAGRPGASASFA